MCNFDSGFSGVPQNVMSTSELLKPVILTVLRWRVFADVSKLKDFEMSYPGLFRWTLNPKTSVLLTDRREEDNVKMEADVPTSQGMWMSLEAGRGQNTALKILWFLTSGLLSGKEYISVVSSHQVCSDLLQQPLKTSTMSKLTVIIVQSLSHVSLGPHGLWHARLLCPPLSPKVCSNSSSQWRKNIF